METLPVKREDDPILSLIAQAALNDVPVEKMERLFELQLRYQADKAREAFNVAFMAMQAAMPIIDRKDPGSRTNTGTIAFFYAKLENIIAQIGHLLTENNFMYTFDSVSDEDTYTAICTLTHISGHSIKSQARLHILPGNKLMTETQRDAGTYTACMRRAFCGVLGIMTADVDSDSIMRSAVDLGKVSLITEIEQLITEKGLDREKQLSNMKVEAFEQQTMETLTKYHLWLKGLGVKKQ